MRISSLSGTRVGISHRPAGFGPVLASKWPVPKRQRLGVAAMGTLFCAAVLVCVEWLGLSWSWAAVTVAATYALVTWMSYRHIVRAGDGWLAKGSRYVRTGQLIVLQAERTLTGVRFTMRDGDLRYLHLRPSEISGNPDIWQLTRVGILTSCESGLRVDAPTKHYFALLGELRIRQPVPGSVLAAQVRPGSMG
jgi:hypothetical protein